MPPIRFIMLGGFLGAGKPTTIGRLARSPRATLTIAASSLVAVGLYALCLAACVRAFGGAVPLASIVVVNWAATTLGNVAPVPGGGAGIGAVVDALWRGP